MTTRRGFMAGILAAAAAPALVRAGMLMPVRSIAVPTHYRWTVDRGHTHSMYDPGHSHDALRYAMGEAGDIMAFPGRPPAGWIPCDGRTLLREHYPRLAMMVHGHSPTHFQVPDLRGAWRSLA
jgi:hypothetical protein